MPQLNGHTVSNDYAVEHRQSQRNTHLTINGVQHRRMTVDIDQCACLSMYGQQHHVGCNNEQCPACGAALIDCGCLNGD